MFVCLWHHSSLKGEPIWVSIHLQIYIVVRSTLLLSSFLHILEAKSMIASIGELTSNTQCVPYTCFKDLDCDEAVRCVKTFQAPLCINYPSAGGTCCLCHDLTNTIPGSLIKRALIVEFTTTRARRNEFAAATEVWYKLDKLEDAATQYDVKYDYYVYK